MSLGEMSWSGEWRAVEVAEGEKKCEKRKGERWRAASGAGGDQVMRHEKWGEMVLWCTAGVGVVWHLACQLALWRKKIAFFVEI